MPLVLPTDTQHLQLETRQYELFNRPLGQGIVRRRLYVGAAVCVVWFAVLLVAGVNPLSRLGPRGVHRAAVRVRVHGNASR
jgi:hypothetical protein